MANPGEILYNHGEVDALSQGVTGYAQMLHALHDDMKNQTDAVAAFFTGEGGSGFQINQAMFLSGMADLTDAMGQHGSGISAANMSAHATDMMIKSSIFPV